MPEFISFSPLWWLLLLLPLALAVAFSLVDRPRWRKSASFLCRILAVSLVVLALCQPFLSSTNNAAHVIFLLDLSESVRVQDARALLDPVQTRINTLPPKDSWSLHGFAAQLAPAATPDGLRRQLTQWLTTIPDAGFRRETNLSRTLLQARLDFPAGKAKRIIIISDGRNTDDDLPQTLSLLRNEAVDLQFVPVPGLSNPEAAILSLTPNTTSACTGEKVRFTIRAVANTPMKASLRLLNRGVVQMSVPINLPNGESTHQCDMIMSTPGNTLWTAEIEPENDYFPDNNRASASVQVSGRPKILCLHREPRKMLPFARALAKQEIEVDVRPGKGLPDTLSELLEFNAVIIANLPATELSQAQMLNLRNYVTECGGGLLMLGSENSFGLGGYYKTPVEEILPIISRYEKEKEKPALAMCLVIDKSGSMSGDKIAMAREAAKAAVELLSPQDQVAIIAFDGDFITLSPMTSAANKGSICAAIDTLNGDGGTNMYPPMAEGARVLTESSAKLKHMIILTDGQSNPGDFLGLAGEMAGNRITVSTVALGDDADAALLAAIAETGRGRFYQTPDPSQIPRIFTRETLEASKSAIKEEPFAAVRAADSPLLDAIDLRQAPFLFGYVLTKMKPTSRLILLTESGDPLLATARFGLGSSAAFTSDATETWAGEWLQWKSFGPFWAQILRSLIRKPALDGLTVNTRIASAQVRLDIRSFSSARAPLPGIPWKATMLTSDQRDIPLAVQETGYGRYELIAPNPPPEGGLIRLHDPAGDQIKTVNLVPQCPREYRLDAKPSALLASLPVWDQQVTAGLPPAPAKNSVHPVLLLAALGMLLAGLLLRRI